MQGLIKKIQGIFPVTTTKAVYMDGTSETLQEAIDNGEIGGKIDLSNVSSSERKAYVFPTNGKIVIDTVGKTFTILKGTRIQLASTNVVITDYTEKTVLDYSGITNDLVICLYWDNTDSKFLVTGTRIVKPDSTHDNYLVTSFLKDIPDTLSLNNDAFIVVNGSDDEVIELTTFGDSLTANGGWQTKCVEKLNQRVTVNNLGIGGSTMALAGGTHNPMFQRVNDIPSTTKVLTIMAGTNDCGRNVSVGELGNGDTTTFIGAYESVIQQVYEMNPTIKIILMTLPPKFNSDGTEPYNTDAFKEATLQVAKKYRIPCINLHDELGINSYTREHLMSDGTVHFGAIAQKQIGAMLADMIKRIM